MVMSPNSIMTIWRRIDWGKDVYIANIIIMYTRAKEIGGKVMVQGENNMLKSAASRWIKYMVILVYGYIQKRQTP